MGKSNVPIIKPTPIYLLLVMGMAILTVNCGGSDNASSQTRPEVLAEDAAVLTFKLDTLSKQSPHCQTDSSNCAKVSLVFPYAERGPTAMCVAFNRLQLKFLKSTLQDVNGEEDD